MRIFVSIFWSTRVVSSQLLVPLLWILRALLRAQLRQILAETLHFFLISLPILKEALLVVEQLVYLLLQRLMRLLETVDFRLKSLAVVTIWSISV